MVSFKAAKNNSKLTDFDGLKDFVVNNTVKSIPRTIKLQHRSENSILGNY